MPSLSVRRDGTTDGGIATPHPAPPWGRRPALDVVDDIQKASEHVASRDIDLAAYPFPELLSRGEVIAEKSKEDPSIEELTDLIV